MPDSFDVAIIGAGPVGDTLALLLGQQGIRTLLADKSPEIYPLPRAAHIDHEIVRVFQQLGVADRVMAASRTTELYDFLTADGQVLMRFKTGGSPSGWPAANMIHQPSVEEILRDRMTDFPAIDLRTGWEMTQFERDGDGVVIAFETPEGPRRVRSRYLVGCDGASSKVRDLIDAALEDLNFDEPWLVIDTLVHDPSRLPAVNLQICAPERPTTCVLMGSGRHRWEFMLKPGETVDKALDDAFIAELLKPWNVEGAVSLERKAVYRFHALIAEQWRDGPVFLAGDAAHQTPPFAGQGLCSGVRDAANLAWKLAAVIDGRASDRLLDSYTPERRPHVRAVIDVALMMGRTVCILDPNAAAARDRQMLANRAAQTDEAATGGFSFPALRDGCVLEGTRGAGELFPQIWADGAKWDDAMGPVAVLISREARGRVDGLHGFSLNDPAMRPFASGLSRWLDAHDAEAVLIRPDRYVFGTGNPDALFAAWNKALS